MIGCDCAVCRSDDPRDRRSRPSVLLELPAAVGAHRHLDRPARAGARCRIPPRGRDSLHAQSRRSCDGTRRCAAVQRAAEGSDPLFRRRATPARAAADVRLHLRRQHARRRRRAAASTCFTLAGAFCLGGVRSIVPCRSGTGSGRIYGFRIGAFAYLTDCSAIPDDSWPLLEGVDLLVSTRCAIGRTRRISASTEALAVVDRSARARLVHAYRHDLPHAATCARLPAGVELAYDGLTLQFAL